MNENRRCEFCGCNTNAKVRACCDAGRHADRTGEITPGVNGLMPATSSCSTGATGYVFEIGQRVKRHRDVFDVGLGEKEGVVVKRYSREEYRVGNTILGPYPELYSVDWDDNTHGS